MWWEGCLSKCDRDSHCFKILIQAKEEKTGSLRSTFGLLKTRGEDYAIWQRRIGLRGGEWIKFVCKPNIKGNIIHLPQSRPILQHSESHNLGKKDNWLTLPNSYFYAGCVNFGEGHAQIYRFVESLRLERISRNNQKEVAKIMNFTSCPKETTFGLVQEVHV